MLIKARSVSSTFSMLRKLDVSCQEWYHYLSFSSACCWLSPSSELLLTESCSTFYIMPNGFVDASLSQKLEFVYLRWQMLYFHTEILLVYWWYGVSTRWVGLRDINDSTRLIVDIVGSNMFWIAGLPNFIFDKVTMYSSVPIWYWQSKTKIGTNTWSLFLTGNQKNLPLTLHHLYSSLYTRIEKMIQFSLLLWLGLLFPSKHLWFLSVHIINQLPVGFIFHRCFCLFLVLISFQHHSRCLVSFGIIPWIPAKERNNCDRISVILQCRKRWILLSSISTQETPGTPLNLFQWRTSWVRHTFLEANQMKHMTLKGTFDFHISFHGHTGGCHDPISQVMMAPTLSHK